MAHGFHRNNCKYHPNKLYNNIDDMSLFEKKYILVPTLFVCSSFFLFL